jgi:hypothetical protein
VRAQKSIMLPEKRAKKNYNDHHPGESADTYPPHSGGRSMKTTIESGA